MLSETEFQHWCDLLNLSTKSRQLIENIRFSEPSRLVSGRSNNVCGRYPSQKMGKTIQFESHRVEAPKIYELEQDENVLEYYDQPPPIKLNYKGANGKNLGVIHTPDLFVLEKDRAGWIECKPEEQLKKLEQKNSNRYHRDADGKWRCPPGEEYGQQFGLSYTVCSDKDFNWTVQRNFLFLEDYYRAESLEIEQSVKHCLIATVSEQAGITLAELLDNNFNADDIYCAIVNQDIYVDLETYLLAEPQRTKIFCNEKTAKAYELVTNGTTENNSIYSSVINLATGSLILWDGKGQKILHAGETEITLVDEDDRSITIAKSMFEDLVCQGKIISLPSTDIASIKEEAWQNFQKASLEDQVEALRRYETIKPYLDGTPPETETVSLRTIRDWKKKYLVAQQKYNCFAIPKLKIA